MASLFNKAKGVTVIPDVVKEAGGGKKNDEGAEENKVGSMPQGDYNVHIHLQSAKNLKMDEEDTVTPYMSFECLGEEKKSTHKENITKNDNVVFNEHHFLEIKNVTNETSANANIKIVCMNRGFFKGDIIGQIELSMSKIYDMDKHTMFH